MDGARALAAERAEGERLRVQLARLKEQLLRGQEDEEDALAWRVEAEVGGQGGGRGQCRRALQQQPLPLLRDAWRGTPVRAWQV
jgi:hypothetical protein